MWLFFRVIAKWNALVACNKGKNNKLKRTANVVLVCKCGVAQKPDQSTGESEISRNLDF